MPGDFVLNVNKVRLWLIVCGAAVAMAALAVAVALLPAVQRRFFLWLASGRPGLTLDVDHVAIRPGSAEIRGLRFQQDGVRVEVSEVSCGISLWQAIVHRQLILRNARVSGMKVHFAHYAGSAGQPIVGLSANQYQTRGSTVVPQAAGAPDAAFTGIRQAGAFTGVLDHLQRPGVVAVDSCEVDADIEFPQRAGKRPAGALVKLTGRNFGPGRKAEFAFDATVRNPDAAAPVSEVTARGAMTAILNSRSVVERVSIHLDAAARGPVAPVAARLQADAVLARTQGGERYSVSVNSIQQGVVSPLLNLDGDYVAGSSTLAGSWQVQADQRQVAPFAFDSAVPEFLVSGDGSFEINFSAQNLKLAGRLAGNASGLKAIDPRLCALKNLAATAAFDLRYDRTELQVASLTARITAGKPVLSVHAVQAFAVNLNTGEITPSGAQRELVRINLDGVPVGWVQSFFPGYELSGNEIEGELVAALHGAGRVWLRTASPLSVRGLAIKRGGRILMPSSDLRVDAEVEHSREGTRLELTNLDVMTGAGDQIDGHGEFSVKHDQSMSGQASFKATLPTLLQAEVPAGPLIAHGSIAMSRSGNVIQVDRMETHLATADGRPLVDLTSPEAFRIDTDLRRITAVKGAGADVLRVKFGRMPLVVPQGCVGSFGLNGELIGGQFAFRAEGGGEVRFSAPSPLRLDNVSISGGGHALFNGLGIEATPAFDYSPVQITAALDELRVKSRDGDLLLSAKAGVVAEPHFGSPRVQGTSSFEWSIPALAGQPVMAGLATPRRGKLTGNVKFSFDRDLLSEGRLTLNGLVAPGTDAALPVANLSFRAGFDEHGEIAFKVPILVDRAGERTDLTLSATLHPAKDGHTVDASVTGQHLAVGDVLVLLRAFSPVFGVPAGSVPRAKLAIRESQPLILAAWNSLTGQVRLDVKSVEYGRLPEVRGLEGRVAIRPRHLAFDNLTAQFGKENAPLRLDGDIECRAEESLPYRSHFVLDVKSFDLGALFREMDPKNPPTIEGLFDAHGRADGAGRTFLDLVRETRGDVLFQSRKGISRLLHRPAPTSPQPTNIVSSVTNSAARLIDNIGDKVGKMVSYTDSTDEIAGMLGKVQFDQLSVRVVRDASPNLRLADFSLVFPVLRLQGAGMITFAAGKSLFDRPLMLKVSLGVMGAVEKAMTQAEAPMLSSKRDDLGYLKSTDTFDVVGTLDKPDPGELYTMVARSMIGKLLH
jgi:hypothetical protein